MKETLMMGTRKESALPVIPKDSLLPEFSYLPPPCLYISYTQYLVRGLGPLCDLCLPVQDEISSITEKTNLETFMAIQQNNFV